MAKLERGIGDVTGWLDWVKRVIGDLKTSGDLQDGDLMEKYANQFAEMAADVVEAVKDGLQISDLMILGTLVPDVMKIAAGIEGASGEEKRRFVVDAVWLVYHSVDTGPDGTQNRIKVPGAHWLSKLGMTATEEKIERFILKLGTEFAINAAYSYMKEKDEV